VPRAPRRVGSPISIIFAAHACEKRPDGGAVLTTSGSYCCASTATDENHAAGAPRRRVARGLEEIRRGAAANPCTSPPEHVAVIPLLAGANTGRSSSGKRIFEHSCHEQTTTTHTSANGRCAAASCGVLLPAPRPRVLRRWSGGALPARREPDKACVCSCRAGSAARQVGGGSGRKSRLSWILRARTGRTGRPRPTTKIIPRRNQTKMRSSPGREAGAGRSGGLQVHLVKKLCWLGQLF
jgi:hypothetical protein